MILGTVRVVNMREPRGDHDYYIGRPSMLGNPFVIGKDGERESVICMYRSFLEGRLVGDVNGTIAEMIRKLVAEVREGHTVTLRCYCAPRPCHGDVIAEVVLRLASEGVGR